MNLTKLASQLTDSRSSTSKSHSTIRGSMRIDENWEVLGPFTEEEFLNEFDFQTSRGGDGKEEAKAQQDHS